jgi:hypothetical protein
VSLGLTACPVFQVTAHNGVVASRRDQPFDDHRDLDPETAALEITVVHQLDVV